MSLAGECHPRSFGRTEHATAESEHGMNPRNGCDCLPITLHKRLILKDDTCVCLYILGLMHAWTDCDILRLTNSADDKATASMFIGQERRSEC